MSSTNHELAQAVAALIAAGSDPKQMARSIAGYLLDQRQTSQLDSLLREVTMLREKDGVVEAVVSSAFTLDADTKKNVRSLLEIQYPNAKNIIITHEVKPEILSGIKIKTREKQLDETARGKLVRLHKAVA